MSDDRLYNMEGIGTVRIKMFDGMVQKLKEVQYVYQLKKILIFVGVLEALSLEVPIRDGILQMIKGSIAILKSVQRNNLYYLEDNTITGLVTTSINSDNDCTQIWHMSS